MATISLAAPAQFRTAARRPATVRVGVNSAAGVGTTIEAAHGATRPETQPQPQPHRQGVRLTRRGRRLARTVVVLLALVAALVLSLTSYSPPSQAGDSPAVSATTVVVVQPGQTLWGVARSLSTDVDVRETVARIQELNGLSGPSASTVRPGQALIVPVMG